MSIIDSIFKKRGIAGAHELSLEEQATFENWRVILSKDELTIADVKELCRIQCSMIESKWADMNLSNDKKSELIPYHTVYRLIAQAIDSPKIAKQALEKQLEGLLNQNTNETPKQ